MRAVRWATVALVAWLVIVHGVPLPRFVRSAPQLPMPAACPASFDRDVPFDPIPAPGVAGSVGFLWDPVRCPNGRYRMRATAVTPDGRTATHAIDVQIIRLGARPVIRYYATQRIWPLAGWVELTLADDKRRQFGLSLEGSALDWSVAVQYGRAMVIEGLALRASIEAPRGTTIRIDVVDGAVIYRRGGVEFYRSAARLTQPASVEVVAEDAQTVLGYLVIGGGS